MSLTSPDHTDTEEKFVDMAYHCVFNESKECDGCGRCNGEVVFYCDSCENEIYDGETCYEICGYIYCEDCINESEITAQRDHYLDDYADEKYEEMRDQELF